MFYVLVDVYLRLGNTVEVFKDVPHGLLHRFHGETKLSVSSGFIACIFDRYGSKATIMSSNIYVNGLKL